MMQAVARPKNWKF